MNLPPMVYLLPCVMAVLSGAIGMGARAAFLGRQGVFFFIAYVLVHQHQVICIAIARQVLSTAFVLPRVNLLLVGMVLIAHLILEFTFHIMWRPQKRRSRRKTPMLVLLSILIGLGLGWTAGATLVGMLPKLGPYAVTDEVPPEYAEAVDFTYQVVDQASRIFIP